MENYFNDSPIISPEEDRFGVDPFARALATSFGDLTSPVGSTVAINGPWGSGKSSVVNLVRHHLSGIDRLSIVDFQCWWFRGEEALTLAFLQALYAALERGIGEKARDLIPKIGKKLLQAGPIIGPAINAATGSPLGAVFASGLGIAKGLFADSESIESLFKRLSDALARQEKRFLLIIDDIDRLTPDEALLIFRLVKSVGRLPNVMYLLVFDRELAEKAVKERYPSEGPHFLEKIIQANFEVPLPTRDDLNNALLAEINMRCEVPTAASEIGPFMNLFYDAVAPYLNTPRDVARLTNAIAVTWPPVKGQVNLGNYIALESMRVFEPSLYSAVRSSKELLCGTRDSGEREDIDKQLEGLVEKASLARREHARDALKRLFPRLQNVGYGSGFVDSWRAQRLVCTKEHFDTYFRLSVGDETLPIGEINELILHSHEPEYVKRAFYQALKSIRKSGRSKVPLLFDELNVHAERIEKANFKPLISAIFEIADDINRQGDKERGFSFGDNHLRIHWLIRKLTFERCDLNERSKIFLEACKGAQLGWLVDFTQSAVADYFPREGKEPEPLENCLVEKERLSELKANTLKAIKSAAKSGDLIKHPDLPYILFRWRDFSDGDSDDVRVWANKQVEDDIGVSLLANAFTSETWSQSMGFDGLGDRVAVRQTKAAVDGLDSILDVGKFRSRLEELETRDTLAEPYKSYVDTLLMAWRRKDRGDDD